MSWFRAIVENLAAMPLLLKLFTVVAVATPGASILMLFPNQEITVFGRQMTASQWWVSGAGVTFLVVGCILLAAAVLMLERSTLGRQLYVVGLVGMYLDTPLVAYLVGVDVARALPMPALIYNFLVAGLIALYLFKSRAVNDYFGGT